MARSFQLSMLLAAVVLATGPVRADEYSAATTDGARQAVMDPYYSHRSQAQQALGLTQPQPGQRAAVARAQYDESMMDRPSLIDPYSTDPGASTIDAHEGYSDNFAGSNAGGYAGDSCGGEGCGDDSCSDCGFDPDAGDGCISPMMFNRCSSGCRWWTSFDYLYLKVQGDATPPLVTTSPAGTSQTNAGVLGEPGTAVLFGNERLNNDFRSGGRVQLGFWLDDEGYTAIEGHYYMLETASQSFFQTASFSTPTAGNQILARPFFNAVGQFQDSLIVAFPSFDIGQGLTIDLDGGIAAREWSMVQSGGLLMRQLWKCNQAYNHRCYLIGGYRFFELAENLQIENRINPVGGIFLPGTEFRSADMFATQNVFNGLEFGMVNELKWWRFTAESTMKVAAGNMHQVLNIAGSSSVFDGLTTTTREGGLLALPTNIGHFNRDRMTVIPEVGLKLGFQATPRLRATIGYSFTYVSRVMRPGNQIDMSINTSQRSGPLVGTPQPQPILTSTSVYLQGMTAGLEYRY